MVLRMASPTKHPKTGVYQFRRRVPKDLVELIGKREVKRSLGTKDSSEAKRLFSDMWRQYDNEWNWLRREPEPIYQKTIIALAGEAYREIVTIVDEEPGEVEIWDTVLDRTQYAIEAGNAESVYGDTADKILREHGFKPDDASRSRLLLEIHRAVQQGSRLNRQKALGDYSPDLKANRFPKIPTSATTASPKGTSLLDLYEAWHENHLREGRAASTAKDWKRSVEAFIQFIGHSDAERVTRTDVIRWRQHLKSEGKLTSRTINGKKLAALQSVFSAGRNNLLVNHDPTEGITEKSRRPRQERPKGFTQKEAETVLTASLAAAYQGSKTAPRTKLAIRWLPWLCAYSGARAGEIAQLRKEDVIEDAIPYIRITPDAGTVKTGQYRDVPLHPHLVEQGFLEFVASRPEGPLFYELKQSTTRSPGDSVRDKVAKWIRDTVGISDKRIQPNHAWRHRFKTISREAGVHREYTNAIQGHSDGSASSGYGEMTMKTLYREIEKIPRYEID